MWPSPDGWVPRAVCGGPRDNVTSGASGGHLVPADRLPPAAGRAPNVPVILVDDVGFGASSAGTTSPSEPSSRRGTVAAGTGTTGPRGSGTPPSTGTRPRRFLRRGAGTPPPSGEPLTPGTGLDFLPSNSRTWVAPLTPATHVSAPVDAPRLRPALPRGPAPPAPVPTGTAPARHSNGIASHDCPRRSRRPTTASSRTT
jgi:hypothetical protein